MVIIRNSFVDRIFMVPVSWKPFGWDLLFPRALISGGEISKLGPHDAVTSMSVDIAKSGHDHVVLKMFC